MSHRTSGIRHQNEAKKSDRSLDKDRRKSEKNGQKNQTELGQNWDKRNRAKNAEEEIWTRIGQKSRQKIG